MGMQNVLQHLITPHVSHCRYIFNQNSATFPPQDPEQNDAIDIVVQVRKKPHFFTRLVSALGSIADFK